jgi:hypothetical protein
MKRPTVPDFRPFPSWALPGPIQRFVNAGSEVMGCDPSYLALPCLAACFAAVGNSRRLRVNRTWEEPAIGWFAIIGESGDGKSPAIDLALRPIRRRQAKAARAHDERMREHAERQLAYERDAARFKSGKGGNDPPEAPAVPVAEQLWTTDATIEALAPMLRENPRGLLVVRDELAGLLAGFDRYSNGGGEAAQWLEMYGGRSVVVNRKGNGRLHVPMASVSIVGGIQPATLRRLLVPEYRENGLAARLAFAVPPRKPKRPPEGDMPEEVESGYAAIIDALYALELTSDPDTGDPAPDRLELHPDAERRWRRHYVAFAEEMAGASGDLAAALSKLEGFVLRLALVHHLASRASRDPRDGGTPGRVSVASMEAAIAMAGWFTGEARRVYAMLAESDADRERRRLAEWIAGRPDRTTTAREVSKHLERFRNDPNAARAALANLERFGAGSWLAEGGKPGRPSESFRLHDPPAETETPRDDLETGGFGGGGEEANPREGWGET